MNKFNFLRVSIFGTRHHHRHRVYYHHGPLSSSYNVPLGHGQPSRQVLPSVVSPCSTRWCTSRRSPLLQQLLIIIIIIIIFSKFAFLFQNAYQLSMQCLPFQNGNQDCNLITFPCNSNSNGRRTKAAAKVVF